MNEKMREEFEAWASKQRLPVKKDGVATTYAYKETDIAWQAWKASRAAVVVEFPEKPTLDKFNDYGQCAVSGNMYYACRRAVESEGLRVKP